MATQQDVIKSFMAALDTTTLSGTAAVDAAVKACSNFNSLQEVIDKMVSDCRAANNANNFLLNYCGINLNNDDTGAITGWDAGGSVVKDKEDIVPETGALIDFTGDSFTVNGLTLKLSGDKKFSDLTDSQQFIWQGLYTWWAKGALDLIAESYGKNFGFDSNSSATYDTMYVYFAESSNLAWIAGAGDYLGISTSYYGNIDTSDKNGLSEKTKNYLDRVLAHEFTHAVMLANTYKFSSLPKFITEGMAELTRGIDDTREDRISWLAGSYSNLEAILNNNAFFMSAGDDYAAGYMLLRYLAKQSANEDDFIRNTLSAEVLTGTSSVDKIRNSSASVTRFSSASWI